MGEDIQMSYDQGTAFIRRLEVGELALSVDVWVDKTTVMELKRLTSAVSD